MTQLIEKYFSKKSYWYFIGIGGCGMSSLSQIIFNLKNKNVEGSDLLSSDNTIKLKKIGIKVNNNHQNKNITSNIDIIIISSAIKNDNPEVIKAKELNIPIYHRSELLNYLINFHHTKIGIMGTHGKGTITGAIGLSSDNINFIVGGILENYNSNYRFKFNNKIIVAEIDESDGSFVNYDLNILLINNLSNDHMDYYQNVNNLIDKIHSFIIKNTSINYIFLNISDYGSDKLYQKIKNISNKKIITFGRSLHSDYKYNIIKLKNPINKNTQTNFKVNNINYKTNLFGEFNVSNMTAAISVLKELNQTVNIENYKGVKNRCQIYHTFNSNCCVKIYAHHPLEFRLVSESFKSYGGRNTVIIYEPFGSEIFMKNTFEEFDNCFDNTTEVIMTPYYLKSEFYNTNTLFNKINHNNKKILETNTEIYNYLIKKYNSNTSFLFFGVPGKFKNQNVLDISDNLIDYFTLKNVDNIYLDSRKVTNNSLFIATKGDNFIDEAIRKGCNSILSEKNLILPQDIHLIKSDNVLKDMSKLAHKFYPPNKIKIIGITGTNGKTSTCFILKSLIEQLGFSTIYIGTLGVYYKGNTIDTEMTTPDSLTIYKILNKFNDADYCVIEVSSHALELYRVNNLHFEIVALTNITSDHLDFHKTNENYIKAKLKIFKLTSKHKLINYKFYSLLENNFSGINLFGDTNQDYSYHNYYQSENGLQFIFKNKKDKYLINAPYIGKFFVENITTALSILSILNFEIKTFKYPKIPGRMEIVCQNPLVLVDFSHTPDALENAIIHAKKISDINKLTVVFGCGGDRDKTKRSIMGKIAYKYADLVLVTSDNPRTENPKNICQEISSNYIVDRKDAIITSLQNSNNTILIAGKGHEDYQIKGEVKYRFNDKILVQTITKYLNKNILVAGKGISGQSAFKLLEKVTRKIKYYDDKISKNNTILENSDIIITSPGFKPNHLIYQNNKLKISEFELGYDFHSDSNWIGITGSNGKTTTVSLLGMIYKYVVGNIGIPSSSLPEYIEYNETIVAEISSAQLLINHNFKPKYAAILNLSPNHIDFHQTFENYKKSKFNLFKNQNKDDFLLVPYCDWSKNIICESTIIYFGQKIDNNCCFIDNKKVYLVLNQNINNIFDINFTNLLGDHNLLNILVAGTIAYLDGKSKQQIEYMIENFKPIEHRLEYYKTVNNVKYINDSKSTTAVSTIAALESINDNMILILGGISKNADPYTVIFNYIINNKKYNIKKIICYGDSKQEALTVSKKVGFNNLIIQENLYQSIIKAKTFLKENFTILLSPACSSFDQFKNYKDRGMIFKKIVDELHP